MREWLLAALEACSLDDEALNYLVARGATPEIIEQWGIKTWDCPLQRCQDTQMAEKYGPYFEHLAGRVVYPLWSARGELLGIDTRNVDRKDDVRVLLAESRWNAVWIGMPVAMDAIWNRRDVYLVEGRFDVFAMLHVVREAAVLGSASAGLSWRQADFLGRWLGGRVTEERSGRVHIVYDMDDAGREGSSKVLRDLQRRGVECDEIRYGRAGDDPGAIWDRGGRDALRAAFPQI
jgi:hypothetical protein